jgi:hypothetical protein
MKRFNHLFLAAALCAFALPALSADFDGSKPLICSAIEANDCALGADCQKGLAENLNMPQFIRLDFTKKTMSSGGRSSPIHHQVREGGMLVMQGFENYRAWSITINETTGKLVGAIAGDQEGFLVFGACTTP